MACSKTRSAWGGPLYLELAQELGLSLAELRQALEEEAKYKERARADFSSGVRSVVTARRRSLSMVAS